MDVTPLKKAILIDIDSSQGPAEVFGEVAEAIAKENGFKAKAQASLQQSFLDREEDGTTAFGFGIALPHVFFDSLKTVRVVVVRHAQGIDLGAFDGVLTNTLVCIAAPESERETYLGLLKHVAQVSRDTRWRKFIEQSPSAAGVVDVLVEAGAG